MTENNSEVTKQEVDAKNEAVIKEAVRQHKGVAVLLDSDDLVRDQVGGFVNFLRDYAVVGLAIGFIVGQQANAVIKQFVDSFVNPLVTILFGKSLNGQVASVDTVNGIVQVPWGAFVYTLIQFFLVLITIYAVIKIFKLDKFTKKKKKKK